MESQEINIAGQKRKPFIPIDQGVLMRLSAYVIVFVLFLHRGSIAHFEQFINQHPFLVTLLNEHADYSYPLVYRFLDKRF